MNNPCGMRAFKDTELHTFRSLRRKDLGKWPVGKLGAWLERWHKILAPALGLGIVATLSLRFPLHLSPTWSWVIIGLLVGVWVIVAIAAAPGFRATVHERRLRTFVRPSDSTFSWPIRRRRRRARSGLDWSDACFGLPDAVPLSIPPAEDIGRLPQRAVAAYLARLTWDCKTIFATTHPHAPDALKTAISEAYRVIRTHAVAGESRRVAKSAVAALGPWTRHGSDQPFAFRGQLWAGDSPEIWRAMDPTVRADCLSQATAFPLVPEAAYWASRALRDAAAAVEARYDKKKFIRAAASSSEAAMMAAFFFKAGPYRSWYYQLRAHYATDRCGLIRDLITESAPASRLACDAWLTFLQLEQSCSSSAWRDNSPIPKAFFAFELEGQRPVVTTS